MRLREPFGGYKLSSGHFMFHLAYIIGSQIATKIVLADNTKISEYMEARIPSATILF